MIKSNLEDSYPQVLAFIQEIEAQHPQDSPYAIANELRRYTRKSYTHPLFRWATLSDVEYIDNPLDVTVILCQQTTDFAHFIAALSDQINLPGWGYWFNFTTAWTGKHSSWSGDLAQAILDFREEKFAAMESALEADASLPDLAANIAAFRVGFMVNQNTINPGWRNPQYHCKISDAILAYDQGLYSGQIREFIKEALGGKISNHQILNPGEIEANIRRAIVEFLVFMQLLKLGIKLKNWRNVNQNYRQLSRLTQHTITPEQEENTVEVRRASLYFFEYLIETGKLAPVH